MMDISKFIQELDEKAKIIAWLIHGRTIHGLPLNSVSYLTKEKICVLYNTDMNYFE